jgi:hypothetical protein
MLVETMEPGVITDISFVICSRMTRALGRLLRVGAACRWVRRMIARRSSGSSSRIASTAAPTRTLLACAAADLSAKAADDDPAGRATARLLTEANQEALVAIELRSGACTDLARSMRVGDEVAEPGVVVGDRWQRLVR